jgi:DNA-binding LacI/PurR family transcriptional regulator
VALFGFDDHPMAATLDPPLSSVRQPIEEMGREMARLLIESVHSPDRQPRNVILSTRLEVRESSAPVSLKLTEQVG